MSNIDIPNFSTAQLDGLDEKTLSNTRGNQDHVGEYLSSILEAGRLAMTGDTLTYLEDELHDAVDHNGKELRTRSHTPASASGRQVTGKAAVIRAQSRAGSGVPVPVFLPHSCIWVVLLPPSENRMLDLWRSLVNDKITLGRYTYGAIFSATSIVTVRKLVDFCLEHVEATSVILKDTNLALLDVIKVSDLGMLFNGMGVAMYPRGIEYSSPCIVDPSTCSHVTKGKLNIETLVKYTNKFPEHIKPVLASSGANTVTLEQVKLAQAELAPTGMYTMTEEVEDMEPVLTDIYFDVPSLRTAIALGEKWVNGVRDSVLASLNLEAPADEEEWSERNLHITRAGKASYLRQYGAWVTKVDMYEGGIVEDNTDDIADVLTALSSSDSAREQMIKFCEDYIKKSARAVVGIATHECPGCHRSPDAKGNGVIALDPVRLFFKFLSLKVGRISARSLT